MPASLGSLREPEAVRANHHAVLQKHVVANAAVLAHHGVRVREKIVADLHPAINHHMRQQHRVRPDLDLLADHDIRPDMSIRPNSRAGIDDGRRMHPRRIAHRLMKQFQRPRERQIRILRPQHRRRNSREVLPDDDGGSPGGPRRRRVLGIGYEREFPRPSLFNSVEPDDFGVGRAVFQARVESRSNGRKFHCGR